MPTPALTSVARAYQVILDGSRVQLIRDGVISQRGEDGTLDEVREGLQELLDQDVDAVFEMGGFTGSLEEIQQRIKDAWLAFVTGDE